MERMLTAVEVSKCTGLAVQTLAKRRVTGDSPPFVKLGRRVVYPETGLKRWLKRMPRLTRTADHVPAASGSETP